MLKRIFIRLLLIIPVGCLFLPCNYFAQTGPNTQAAQKFDEFGDILYSDLMARLDNFAMQLQQSEPGARGFVIIYRSRRDFPGLSSRLASPVRDYLVNTRGFAKERIVTVDGGEASCLTYELWIVPVGSAPKPREDAYTRHLRDSEAAWKFDEYFYPLPGEAEYPVGNSLEGFAEVLRKQPRSDGFIIAYSQYYRGKPDAPHTAATALQTLKANMVKKYRIAPSRIKILNGGYRIMRQVELWIVPRSKHAPIPTPNAFPKRRR